MTIKRSVDETDKIHGFKHKPPVEHYTSSWSMPRYVFPKYVKDYPIFIETGTYVGGAVYQALSNGFQEVFSIEVDKAYYEYCLARFRHNGRVHLLHGSSADLLPSVMEQVNSPAMIWLDAHWWKEGLPLEKELEAIKNHHIKNHLILIDDINLLSTDVLGEGIPRDSIVDAIKSINPEYNISYIDNAIPNYYDQILIAEIL